jgi:hypothetical protein
MKNFDTIMKNMTVERMAELGVKLVNVNGRDSYYMTSTGQLYTMADYESAVQHEYNWLQYDPAMTQQSRETTNVEAKAEMEGAPDSNETEKG